LSLPFTVSIITVGKYREWIIRTFIVSRESHLFSGGLPSTLGWSSSNLTARSMSLQLYHY